MLKKDISRKLKENLGKKDIDVSLKHAEDILTTFLETLEEIISIEGEEVVLGHIGKLKNYLTKERNAVNPKTKEKLVIKPKNKIKFKFSKSFEEKIN